MQVAAEQASQNQVQALTARLQQTEKGGKRLQATMGCIMQPIPAPIFETQSQQLLFSADRAERAVAAEQALQASQNDVQALSAKIRHTNSVLSACRPTWKALLNVISFSSAMNLRGDVMIQTLHCRQSRACAPQQSRHCRRPRMRCMY